MGPLLALHLGVVFALFITMPYGKFVHGIYRYVALVRYARERRTMARACQRRHCEREPLRASAESMTCGRPASRAPARQ